MPKSKNRGNNKKYFGNKLKPNSKTTKKVETNKQPIILGEYVFPIYGLRNKDGDMTPFEIHGTCFCIGMPYFLTALHVVREAKTSEQSQIGYFEQLSSNCVNMSDYEVCEEFPEHDLAIIKSETIFTHNKKPKTFNWKGNELLIFEDVRAMGFPLGYDAFKGISIGRGYSGTILCSTPYERGELKTNCYELSFQAPKGLSGGVLIDKWYNIHGMIIGNSEKSMNVFYEKREYEDEGKKVKQVEEVNQTTFIGLAVKETQIFKIDSEVLCMTIHDYLKKVSLH